MAKPCKYQQEAVARFGLLPLPPEISCAGDWKLYLKERGAAADAEAARAAADAEEDDEYSEADLYGHALERDMRAAAQAALSADAGADPALAAALLAGLRVSADPEWEDGDAEGQLHALEAREIACRAARRGGGGGGGGDANNARAAVPGHKGSDDAAHLPLTAQVVPSAAFEARYWPVEYCSRREESGPQCSAAVLSSTAVRSQLWSPYALPRSVDIKLDYHHRTRSSWVDFGVAAAVRCAPRDGKKATWTPLFSCAFEDVPETGVEHIDRDAWRAVEAHDARGLDARGVATLRRWLFAEKPPGHHSGVISAPPQRSRAAERASDCAADSAAAAAAAASGMPSVCHCSLRCHRNLPAPVTMVHCPFPLPLSLSVEQGTAHRAGISDYALLSLVLAACGARLRQVHVGHTWRAYAAREAMARDGAWRDELADTTLSWVEHRARAATGALRPVDRYYEPYDVQSARTEWGREICSRLMDDGLMREEERARGSDDDDDDDDDDYDDEDDEEDAKMMPYVAPADAWAHFAGAGAPPPGRGGAGLW
ncbi:hypothetical protein JKP88DRAFT_276086 [Tribonema minus]|uniref:Uncharacterized protein n=1 Tax=Tribonema minus TaxID=303371 RepID=A0A836CJ80_9STRA|nr:hypothetical protein JKP88DRAFT_276086 [Tribonema minus]